jgi:hypothetical protein
MASLYAFISASDKKRNRKSVGEETTDFSGDLLPELCPQLLKIKQNIK